MAVKRARAVREKAAGTHRISLTVNGQAYELEVQEPSPIRLTLPTRWPIRFEKPSG